MSEISDLMDRDPLKLTKSDRAQIIDYYRNNRSLFLAGGKPQGVKPKTEKKEKTSLPGLSLSDLGL